MKRNRTPSLSGSSTGENNNTSIVNKKQKVLFTPCRRVGLTRKSLKSANNSLLNATQTNTNTATTKDTAKRKSLVLDEKLSVFDFKDSPRSSPQNPTYTSKPRDDVTPTNVVDMEICSIINEPTSTTETPKMKSKRGISHKITEPVQHSIDQDTPLNLNLSPKVLLCKLDLNKIKISSPYTISDSEESEMSKSPKKIHSQHKKSIKEKIEFATKTSEDVEPQISPTGANIQFNKLSKRKPKAVLTSQTNLLTSKPQESSDKITDVEINPITANETDNSHNNRVSSNLVDDALNFAAKTKTRKNRHSSCLKKKKHIASNSQEDKIELNSSQLISLNENVETSKIESDTIKETIKSQNTISDSESDSNEPLIRLKYPKRANLKSTKTTTESPGKHIASTNLKTKSLRSSTFRSSLAQIKESDTNLEDSTSSKHKKSTKITSSETQEIESLKHDKSTKVTAVFDNLGWEKHETRPNVKSKGSRKLYSDSPQFLEELPTSIEPENFGWEKHESTPISTCEKAKELYVTLTSIPALETQKSSATSPESKNSALDKPPIKSKKDVISQSLDSDKETKLDCGTSKHKKSTKYTDEGHDSIWEKYKTEAKRRQEKDASNLKHKQSTKPIETTGWEKHETPVNIKPKKITKLAFPSEDWNKELQELDMHIQTKINSNLKRKTPKLSSELLDSNLVTEIKEPVTDLQSKKDLTNIKHKKTKTVSESQDSTKVADTIKPKASGEIAFPKVQKDTNKVSETIKPKASPEIAPPKVQEGVVKNMLSVVNLANLKDIDYIKRVAESEGSVLDQQNSSTSKLASVESDESVKIVEVSTNQDLKSIESKLRAGIRESIKEAQNVYKNSIEIQGSPNIIPDLSLKSSKDSETKESNKLTPSQHSSNENQALDIYLQPNVSQTSDLSDLRPNELHNSGLISYKHKKSTTLFPSTNSQNSINDLLELDVNLQVLKSQPNRILSDDESITSELNFVQTKEPPKLKSCLSKKSKFTTAIQEIKETNSYQLQNSRSLKLNSQSQNSNFDASEYSQSPDLFDNDNESSQHTEKRKNRRSACSKHKKHISKPSTSNKIDYPEKSTPSFDYSDSEDDFREKKILGRRRKSSSSLKTDDRVKGKKLIKPVVDELNKTEHIRIRENISYTIIHKGNVISYVKSHDNDVDMKTTESDDNQQAPVLIKMCTKSTESRKSMIIERRNYTSTNTSLSVSDKENSDTENEISIIANNEILDAKKEDKKPEPEKKRKINSENKLFGTNKLLEEKKTTHETVEHNRKKIISENKPAQESRVMEQCQKSVVENGNKKTENEKTTLRNELLEARVTNKKQQEIVVEKSPNCEIENNEKEKSVIRTELIGTRKLTAQEPVIEENIQTSTNTENKEIEQEKTIIRNELLGAKKKIQTNLNSDNIDQENVAIRNELLEVRKKCKKLELYTERIQIEQEKLYIRNELIENRKKDKRRISEKIRKHKASQQVKDPSIIKATQTVKSASTSSAIDNSTTENMMTVEQIKKEIKATESRLKVRQEQLDRLNRLQNYKNAHDLTELRNVVLQIKSGCREALIDLLLVLKEHSNAQFDMGTLLHNMKISNDLVGYNEEEDCFV